MFFTRWMEGWMKHPKPRKYVANSNLLSGLRPTLETLSERVVPHSSGFLFDSAAPYAAPWSLVGSAGLSSDAVATELRVVARSSLYAGSDTNITVVAIDASGRPVRNYTGTVTFTSSDSAAVLPESYTFTTDDRGRHTFKVNLSTIGEQTITATDATTNTILGSATINVQAAPVATQFFVKSERDVYTGAATRVVVAALDESNRIVSSYTGTVALTSSDTGATLPASYTFTSSERGVHTFEFTPSATGEITITATDTTTASITGSVTTTVSEAPVVSRFAIITRPLAASGTEFTAYIVALDDSNHVVRNYTGTVALTSSDTAAVLPSNNTFTTSDGGVKAVKITLNTSGSQTLTATDTSNSALTASTTISVGTSSGLPRFGGLDGFGGGFRRRR